MFLLQLIPPVSIKVFENYSKIHLQSAKFEKQCIKIILSLLKIQSCEKVLNIKILGNNKKKHIMYFVFSYFASLSKILRKLPK